MRDLGLATNLTLIDRDVEHGRSTYSAELSRDWEIWGPMGGYVAAFALRAAGAHCGSPRPASLVGHFLGVANFEEPLTITCTSLRVARTAHSVRAVITQSGTPIFDAMVWGTNDGLIGLEHHAAPMPEFDHWSQCPTVQERLAAQGESYESWFPFWLNFIQRPAIWRADWNDREPHEEPPDWHNWLQFAPTASFTDPWIDACRLLILVDVGSWPATQSYHNSAAVIAPSIDLACHFHCIDPNAEWLFIHANAPVASAGLVESHQRVWSDDGRLLASGISQLLCRPVRPQ